MIYGLILAGGSGSRLWPCSRSKSPKQFLNLTHPEYSLIQETYLRLKRHIPETQIWTITNQDHSLEIQKQLNVLSGGYEVNLLMEPEGKNTAPAILWAALVLEQQDPEAIMVVLPSDHVIQNIQVFKRMMHEGFKEAQNGYLVTFGIEPNAPETGFGYIQMGERHSGMAYQVQKFVEKPDRETAEMYLQSDLYVWNSGMFVFPVKILLEYFQNLTPDLWNAFQRAKHNGHWDAPEVAAYAFKKAPSISIDYAIMEKAENVLVLPAEMGWSDMGSWEALYQYNPKDLFGNSTSGDVIALETKNSLILSSHKLVTTIGIENLIVVETEDSLLVCDMKHSQDVKTVVEILQSRHRKEGYSHLKESYSWGGATPLHESPRQSLRLLEFLPQVETSIKNGKTSKFWLILQGKADIFSEEKSSTTLNEMDRYTLLGNHSYNVKNNVDTPLKILEVISSK